MANYSDYGNLPCLKYSIIIYCNRVQWCWEVETLKTCFRILIKLTGQVSVPQSNAAVGYARSWFCSRSKKGKKISIFSFLIKERGWLLNTSYKFWFFINLVDNKQFLKFLPPPNTSSPNFEHNWILTTNFPHLRMISNLLF